MDFSQMIAITISPPFNYKYRTDKEWLFEHYTCLRPLFKDLTYLQLWQEFDSKFRLHHHGFIRFKSKASAYKIVRKIKKTIGFVLLKPIKDSNVWLKYCTKEWDQTKEILKLTNPITLDTRLIYNEDNGRLQLQSGIVPSEATCVPGEEITLDEL